MAMIMSALERYDATIDDQVSKAAASERLALHPPKIGEFSKLFQALLPNGIGGEFEQARRVFVEMPGWGPGTRLDLAVYSEHFTCPNGSKRTQWHCFHWPTGSRIAQGNTRIDAIHNALVEIERHGKAAFDAAVDIAIEKNGGKRLN